MDIATQIKLGLSKRGMTPEQLAEDLEIDDSVLQQWLSSGNFNKKELRRIANILSLPDLVDNSPEIDKDKLCGMVLYFCKSGATKSKISKLLFYSDFRHYKKYGEAISNFEYINWPFGPGPSGFNNCIEHLLEMGAIYRKAVKDGDVTIQVLVSRATGEHLFGAQEIETLECIQKEFQDFTAKKLTEFCLQEEGCQKTYHGSVIHYRHSEALKI